MGSAQGGRHGRHQAGNQGVQEWSQSAEVQTSCACQQGVCKCVDSSILEGVLGWGLAC